MIRALQLLIILCLGFVQGCKRPTPIVQIEERADPIVAIASLSDPKKLKTLKPENRSVNGRMDKILYWLFIAEQKGIKADEAVMQAFSMKGSGEPRFTMAKNQVVMNYRAAKRWGLLTKENLERLKSGHAAVFTAGSYIGEKAEIDHIVPLARYPQFANELANLQVMPGSMNRSKGDRMGHVEFEKLKELQGLNVSVRAKPSANP